MQGSNMKRISVSLLTLGCLIVGSNNLSWAQNSTSNTEPRVLHRSYATVEPASYNQVPNDPATADSIAPSATLATSQTTTTGSNFPSLNPRIETSKGQGTRGLSPKPFSGSLLTVGCSLGVVLGLFAGLVWVTRRFGARSMAAGGIPKEALQPLGSSPIDARTNLTLVRCGNRILVLARTATGIQPLSEITDPKEVRHLTALCLGDSKKEFASTLEAIEQEETPSGYVGAPAEKPTPRSRGRLFATA